MKLIDNTLKGVERYIEDKLNELFSSSEIVTLANTLFTEQLNISKQQRLLDPTHKVTEGDLLLIIRSVNRLLEQEPIDYIVGNTEFYGLRFKVGREVLIPRPETEELCEWIISEENKAGLKVVDIGSGSGCIAITLVTHLINAKVYACDVSAAALSLCTENAVLNSATIDTKCFDVLKQFPFEEKLDIIVSNPPYVLKSDKSEMEKNVLDYEPHLALFVEDNDPLLFYRKIAEQAKLHLNPNGRLYFEIHERYSIDIQSLLSKMGFSNIEVRKDAQDKDRMVRAVSV